MEQNDDRVDVKYSHNFKRKGKKRHSPPPTTSQLSLPVNDDRCLHAFLGYLLCRDVVPQSVEGSTDERRLLIKEGSPRGQALRRGSQECGPERVPQRLGQRGLT